MIMTLSGRAVKPKTFKRPTKMGPGTAQIVRAQRRAKAPAPWANEAWSLTEQGRVEAGEDLDLKDMDLDAPPDPARFEGLTEEEAEELRGMEAAALADDAAWVLREYKVTPDGDHLRFQGHAPGDFARVSIPAVGEKTLVWRSSLAYMSDAAFLGAAGQWAAQGKGADHAR